MPNVAQLCYSCARATGGEMTGRKVGLKRALLGASLGVVAFGTAGASQAAELWGAVPYLAIGGGLNFASDPTVGIFQDLGVTESHSLSANKQSGFGTGGLGLITAGLDFKNGWRTELEGSYRHNSSARFNVQAEGSTTVGVDRTTYALMANVWRDFALVDRVGLHVGGGLGVAEREMNVTSTYSGSTSINYTGGAYQVGAGLDFILMPGLKATLDYRIFGLFSGDSGNILVPTSCGVSPSGGTCSGNTHESVSLGLSSTSIDQSIIFGLRWSLGL